MSPAARVGFRKGDVVLCAQGKDVTSAKQLAELVEAQQPPLAHQVQPRRARVERRHRGMSGGHEPRRFRNEEPLRGGGARPRRAASARRPAAPAHAFGDRRPGGADRAGRRADAHARHALARLARVLGAARHRQDDCGAASRQGDRPRLPADFRHPFRRRGAEEDLRGGARPARDGAGDAALRRRDPPLQPRAAGFLPARHGGRDGDAGRRHHREPVLRAERRASFPRPRARLQAARRGGAGEAARARRGERGARAAARRGGARRADPARRRRRPRRALAGGGGVAGGAARARPSTRRG